jgi:hypothetical protein
MATANDLPSALGRSGDNREYSVILRDGLPSRVGGR